MSACNWLRSKDCFHAWRAKYLMRSQSDSKEANSFKLPERQALSARAGIVHEVRILSVWPSCLFFPFMLILSIMDEIVMAMTLSKCMVQTKVMPDLMG